MLDLPTISPLEFRDAMRRFPGAVNILTTDGSHGMRGVTVSAVASVSDNPATVLVCVFNELVDNHLFSKNKCFAINTLSSNQQALARVFSGEGKLPMNERFAKGSWSELVTGSPVLKGAHVALDCRVIESKLVATHQVIFGEVVGSSLGDSENALVYLDRKYHDL